MSIGDTMARDYKREYALYQGTAEQKHERALRNKARREMIKDGKAHKGDHKDVDHIVPLSKGGSETESNYRVVPEAENRSFARTKTNALKSQVSKREKHYHVI